MKWTKITCAYIYLCSPLLLYVCLTASSTLTGKDPAKLYGAMFNARKKWHEIGVPMATLDSIEEEKDNSKKNAEALATGRHKQKLEGFG